MTGTSLTDLSLLLIMVPIFVSLLVLAILSVFAGYDYTRDRLAARRDRRCTSYASAELALIDQLEQMWRIS